MRHGAMRAILGVLLCALPAAGQVSNNLQDWMTRLNSAEFAGGGGGRGGRGAPGRWIDGGKAYRAAERDGIVRYDTATGKREVVLTTAQLTPPALGRPIQAGEFEESV